MAHFKLAAQDDTMGYILSGTVVNGESNELLSGVHIIKNNHFGTYTNENGVFEINVMFNDTLTISHIGYKPLKFIVPKQTEKTPTKFLTKFKLFEDSVSLETVEIFPWPSFEDFRDAFKELNLKNEEIKIKGVKLYQDRNIEPYELKFYNIATNPISLIYDRLFDKKAKIKRRIDRRRKTINQSQ